MCNKIANMKKRKLLSILFALLVMAVPAMAVFTGMGLDATLSNLRRELYHDYLQISKTHQQMESKYEVQHKKMVDIVKKCNDMSLMLYSQKQDYTFDISYALEKVTQEYRAFNKNRTPYDRIVSSLDVEIDKYAVASFNAMHGTNFEPQDITKWDKDIQADLIMHGSPCQDFSLAGKQAGGDEGSGTRSSLMYETIRIVEKLKPKYVIWENVKNVISKKHKHNFDNYIKKMDELGYRSYY